MKTKILQLLAILSLAALLLTLAACDLPWNNTQETEAPETGDGTSAPENGDGTSAPTKAEKKGAWKTAVYFDDQTFGSGKTTVTVEVRAENQSITFTLHTDKETLGDAMLEHDLLEGEEGPYGLYVKHVNGIEADFDKDQTYWSLSINGNYAMTGVDSTKIEEGTVYRLEKTK